MHRSLLALERSLEHVVANLENTVQKTAERATGPVTIKVIKRAKKGAARPKSGDRVRVNYTGKLLDGTVFDSSLKPGRKPFEFSIQRGQVIRGWDEALLRMQVGEKAKVTISPEYAYGQKGKGPIPPNATLIFTIEFIAII